MRLFTYFRKIAIHFLALLFLTPGYGQLDAEGEEIIALVKESLGKVLGSEPTIIAGFTIEKKANGERHITGPVSIFNKNELQLKGIVRPDKKPSFFSIDFPSSAVLNLGNLNALTGGNLGSFLPAGFSEESGIIIKNLSIHIDATGYTPEKIEFSFGGNRSFSLIGDGALVIDKTSFDFSIEEPKSPQRQITGKFSGSLLLGSTPLELNTVLTNRKEDIKFTGTLSNLSLMNLLSAMGGTAVANTLPPIVSSLALQTVNFEIVPYQKTFAVTARSSLGEVELKMSPGKNGGRMQFLLGIAPPSSFKFSSLDPGLALMDGIDLSGTALVISSYNGPMESSMQALRSGSGQSQQLVNGLNVFSHIKLGDELGRFLGKPELDLYGSVDRSLNFNLDAVLDFDNLKLAEGMYFREVKFGVGFRPAGAKVNFRLNGRMEATIKGDLLSFSAGFDFSPTDVQLSAFFLMEALKKANAQLVAATRNANNELEPPEWNEPFGVKGVGLRKLGFSLGLSPKSPVFLSSLGLTADVRIGVNPDFNKNIKGAFTAAIDIANPFNSMLDIKLQNLTIIGMVDAFRPNANISGTLRKWLDWGLENAYLRIVPESRVYLPDNKHYERGILAGGTLKLGGLSATAELAISETSFGFKAMVDPIDFSSGGFTWFALKGFEQGDKAQVNLQLNSSDPEMVIDGSITVLGISSRTSIKINSAGAKFKVQGDAASGALSASLEVEAQQLSATSGFRVKAEFSNKLQSEVAKQLVDFIKRESAKSQAAYSNAQNSLQRARNASNNDAEKGLIDAAKGFVSAFKEIDKGMAVAGQYVVKGIIGEAINVHRIYFESNLTKDQFSVVASIDMTIAGQRVTQSATIDLNISSMTAMAEKIVDQIGNAVISAFENAGSEIENGWNQFVQGADQFFSEAGKGIEQLGKDFEKAGVIAVNWVAGAAMTVYNWGDETFNGRKVDAPSQGNAPAMIPFNVTQYVVTITGVRVDKIPSTNLGITTHYPDGNELEIFGSITIIPNGRLWTNSGSNMYGFNRRQGDYYAIARGNTQPLHTPKYFYAKDQDAPAASVTIYTHLYDNDDQNIFTSAFVANEEMRNTSRVSFGNLYPGQSVPGQITAYNRDNDHGITVFYTVTALPKISNEEMSGAVNSRNPGVVESTIRQGGNPFLQGLMQTAIRNNDAGTLQVLGKYGVAVSADDMNLAVSSAPGMIETLINLGGIVGINELNRAIEMRNENLVSLILRKGVQPDLNAVRKAIQLQDIKMVKQLTQQGVLLGIAELEMAIGQGNAALTSIILENGAVPSQATLVNSVRNRQEAIIQLLVGKITPGHESLHEAARNNNPGLFRFLAEKGGTLQNSNPVFSAIDNNNSEILVIGLKIGGNPTEALRYAIQKNNTGFIQLCLENRADPAAAIGYAVQSNNINLLNSLLQTYRVSPNECMREAIAHNNTAAGTAALSTGQVSCNSFMAAAAEKNNIVIVKALTESQGNPDLAMPPAVRLNNTELVSYLISKGAHTRNEILIRQAVQNNSAEMVRILTVNGANVNAGMPYAIDTKNMAIIKLLFDYGASPFGYILKPAADGNLELVKLLLDRGAIPDEGMDAGVLGNHTAVVKMLLMAGAKPQGFIQIPAAKNNPEMVSDLLRAGASPDPGMRPAVDGNFTPIVRLLLDKGASAKGYLQKPSSIGNLEMVAMLLDKNADPNEGIEAAIRGNHTPVIKLLVEKGADGRRLLAIPSGFGNLEIVQLLLLKGANPETGIRAAVEKGHAAVSEVLLKAGADGTKKEYMDISVAKYYVMMIPVLVKAGNKVDSSVVDQKGRTHLHNAAEMDNSLGLIKALLEAGSSVHAKDFDGNTPLHMAVDEGKDDIETVRALLLAGADPCAQNNKKRNIFKQAKGSKVKKLIKEFGGSRKCADD